MTGPERSIQALALLLISQNEDGVFTDPPRLLIKAA